MKWTKTKLIEEALKYKTKMEFRKKSTGAYAACHKMDIIDLVCSHMPNMRTSNRPIKWNPERILEEALKYDNKEDFVKKSSGAADAARRYGLWNDVCKHMLFQRKKWTYKDIKIEALKYSNRNDFRKRSSAYGAARYRGILDDVCSHMATDRKIGHNPHNKKWTIETITEEAKKYSMRSEFKQSSEGAYDAAKEMKILDLVCSHMKLSNNSSRLEIELLNEIRKVYPTTNKLRDRMVNIIDKPHIKGFDIDAFVPELKKGIELDGEYWHSFEVMKRNKKNWPEEDVKNYHIIKDVYFKSKEINILHITDREWKNDKEQSLSKILEFLKK